MTKGTIQTLPSRASVRCHAAALASVLCACACSDDGAITYSPTDDTAGAAGIRRDVVRLLPGAAGSNDGAAGTPGFNTGGTAGTPGTGGYNAGGTAGTPGTGGLGGMGDTPGTAGVAGTFGGSDGLGEIDPTDNVAGTSGSAGTAGSSGLGAAGDDALP